VCFVYTRREGGIGLETTNQNERRRVSCWSAHTGTQSGPLSKWVIRFLNGPTDPYIIKAEDPLSILFFKVKPSSSSLVWTFSISLDFIQSMAPKKIGAGKGDSSILAKISNYDIVSQGRRAACDAVYVSKKLLKSTGKAAWIAGTTFLILAVPLILELEQDHRLGEIDFEQASLLGTPPVGAML